MILFLGFDFLIVIQNFVFVLVVFYSFFNNPTGLFTQPSTVTNNSNRDLIDEIVGTKTVISSYRLLPHLLLLQLLDPASDVLLRIWNDVEDDRLHLPYPKFREQRDNVPPEDL